MRHIIVDSGSSIKPEEAKALGLDVLPIRINIGGREYSDGVDIDSSSLYYLMEETKQFPKTALPRLDLAEELVKGYAEKGDEVLILPISSALSGTYSSLCSLLSPYKGVKVFDTKQAAGGIRILALEALKHADMDLDSLCAHLEHMRRRISLISLPETLDYLLKGGRLKKAAWMLGTLLRILPVISLGEEGEVISSAKVRGLHNGIKYLSEKPVEEGIDTSVLVLNAGAGVPADAPDVSHGQCMGLDPIEVSRIQQFKVALIHLGNVRPHIIWKARLILRNVDIPAMIVAQCPIDFEDFAAIGVKTRMVMPDDPDINTKGSIQEIVTGVIRGVSCPQEKLDEIVSKIQRMLPDTGGEVQ